MNIIKFIVFIIVNITLLFSFLFLENHIWLFLACLLWVNITLFSLFDINKRSVLFTFSIAFFVFLMGRHVLEAFFAHTPSAIFSDEINKKVEIAIFISLLFLIIGYAIGRSKLFKSTGINVVARDYDSFKYKKIRKVSLLIFYLTYFLLMASTLDIAIFVREHGYLSYYKSYSPNIPYLLQKVGDMAPISFFVFLATMPKKKECKLPIILYIFYLVLTLATGKRFTFVVGLLTLFVYFIIRNRINSEGKLWFGKREAIISVITIPFIITLLGTINNIRFGKTNSENYSMFENIVEFFYNQGVSINVLKYTLYYSEELPDRIFTFGSLIRLVKANIFSKLIGIQSFSGNTVENALYGNSYEYTISYFALKKAYLAGSGLGSSYIAEVFHDFGFIGLAVASLIYGLIISRLFNSSNMGIWFTAISFNILKSLLFSPRGSADAFIAELFDITTLGTFLMIFVLAKVNTGNTVKNIIKTNSD